MSLLTKLNDLLQKLSRKDPGDERAKPVTSGTAGSKSVAELGRPTEDEFGTRS